MIPIIDTTGKLTGVTTFEDVFNVNDDLDNIVEYINTTLPKNPNVLDNVYKKALDQFCTKMVTYNMVDAEGELNIQAMTVIKKLSTCEFKGEYSVNGPVISGGEGNISFKRDYACLGLPGKDMINFCDPSFNGPRYINGKAIVQVTCQFQCMQGNLSTDVALIMNAGLRETTGAEDIVEQIGIYFEIDPDEPGHDPEYPQFKERVSSILSKTYGSNAVRSITIKKAYFPFTAVEYGFSIPTLATNEVVLCNEEQ